MHYLLLIANHRDLRALSPLIKIFKENKQYLITIAVAGSDFINDEQNQKSMEDNDVSVDLFLESTTVKSAQGRAIKLSMISAQLSGFLAYRKIDAVIVNGDSLEAFSAASCAFLNNVQVIHIGGGEKTTDYYRNALRFSISRFACLHLVSTKEAFNRLKQTGEPTSTIQIVGASEVDSLLTEQVTSPSVIERKFGVKPEEFVLLIQRPEINTSKQTSRHITQTLAALREFEYPIVALEPETEPGSDTIEIALRSEAKKLKKFNTYKTLPRQDFLGLLRNCRFLIGNTSLGIVEAATFGRMVVNIGERQLGREHAYNVIDVPSVAKSIVEAIEKITDKLVKRANSVKNIYGEGKAGMEIYKALQAFNNDADNINKKLNL